MSEEFDAAVAEEGPAVDMYEAYFEARGWAFERLNEGEVMASATGSWAQYEMRAVYRPEDGVIQFLAFPDIKVTEEKRRSVHEVLGLINEQLWLGHFEFWSQAGIIVFRQSSLVEPSGTITLGEAETTSEAALEECERFYPVFQFVLWGGKSPSEAIAAALIDTHGEA